MAVQNNTRSKVNYYRCTEKHLMQISQAKKHLAKDKVWQMISTADIIETAVTEYLQSLTGQLQQTVYSPSKKRKLS